MKIYLASRSARRPKLLDQVGIDYELIDIEVDESWDGEENPEDYVCRIAQEKARAGKDRSDGKYPVLAADTTVVLDGEILGKAENHSDAKNMLQQLSGKAHYVLSAVTVIDQSEKTRLNISKVIFREISAREIEEYSQSDEPIGKAGGYAIQGKAAMFIKKLEGSYSGVMGLPLYETWQLLNNDS